MAVNEIINELKSLSSATHFAKLKHFGISDSKALGVKIPLIRNLAKTIGRNHELSIQLWDSEIHEARILASMLAEPHLVTESHFDKWVNDFDSWDLCDQTCSLLWKTPFVLGKIDDYANNSSEFVKRTAFTLMCVIAVHDKKAKNELFYHFFDLIEREAWDERNFVRKAVNWALRQIGKRSDVLRVEAVIRAERIHLQGTKSAKWIANDAIRELTSPQIIFRVNQKTLKNIKFK